LKNREIIKEIFLRIRAGHIHTHTQTVETTVENFSVNFKLTFLQKIVCDVRWKV